MSGDGVIYGGTALTMDGQSAIIPNSIIEVCAGRIKAICAKENYVPPPGVKGLDATGCLVMPGFINGHTHVGMTLFRGIADDLPFHTWLNDHIFPIERKWVSEELVATATTLAAAEMIRSGTTTLNDMYYLTQVVAKTLDRVGLRALCGFVVIEIGHVGKPTQTLADFEMFTSYLENFPLIEPTLAPHGLYGVSKELFRQVIELAKKKDVLIHTHLAETQEEVDECYQRHGVSPVEYLDGLGLWSCKVSAAHCTCLSEKEIEILGRNKVGATHNPESNLKLGTKICPVTELRAVGCSVALGTDSVASNNNLDLLAEAGVAARLQTLQKGIGSLRAEDVVRMLTIEGAASIGMADRIGSLEVGKSADIIAIDVNNPHAVPLFNPYSHLVYSANSADVKHSMVNGKVLMENFRLNTIDEKALLKQARDWGERIKNSS
ncbi:MAG: amidohydrolase [Deltaproteobacteria bacterium]|nr:amidohydrolase [Deltaproteobacteria bacterium]